MAIKFEFYPVPNKNGAMQKQYYPKVVNTRTVDTEELAKKIQDASTLTTADIHATIEALSNYLAQHLSDSERVHIEGLGYFEVSLQCPETDNPKELRAENVRFKSVNFRADKKLKEKMATSKTIRSKKKVHSADYTPEKIDEIITEFFKTHAFMTRRDLESICNLAPITANRQLKRLTEEKKLRNAGNRYHPIYVPTEGNYGF